MKKAAVIFIHCGYWLIYLLLLAVIFAIAAAQIRRTQIALPTLFPVFMLCVAPNLVSFYAFYFLLFSRFLSRRKIFALVISGAAICLIVALAGTVVSTAFFSSGQAIFANAREFVTLAASFFVIAAIHGGIALVIHGFIKWYAEIKLKEELAQKNFEMELALIKSQINPHFLFNTLNNIDVLITKNAALASVYLNKLSDILRYMVYETRSEKIALAAELDYVEKYLELQKIRTTNPDYINFTVAGSADNLQIAPMILFPFIENAFKHTENRKSSNSIRIKIKIEKEKIVFECENTYRKNADAIQEFGGVGNDLIKKRLELLYPEKHTLKIIESDDIFKVLLEIENEKAI